MGALSWLQAVRDCIGEPVVFALDNALMCQGNFGGRSDEYIVWVYGDDSVMKFNGVVVLGNRIGAQIQDGTDCYIRILTERYMMPLQMKIF